VTKRRDNCPKLWASTPFSAGPSASAPTVAGYAVKGAIFHEIDRRLPFLRVPIELDVGHRRGGGDVREMARMLGEKQLQAHVAIGDHPPITVMSMARRLLHPLRDGLIAELGL
jgi:hypothetical protein